MTAVKNFAFLSLHALFICKFSYHMSSVVSLLATYSTFKFLLVEHTKSQVKCYISVQKCVYIFSYVYHRSLLLLFLKIKRKWPKNKSICDLDISCCEKKQAISSKPLLNNMRLWEVKCIQKKAQYLHGSETCGFISGLDSFKQNSKLS